MVNFLSSESNDVTKEAEIVERETRSDRIVSEHLMMQNVLSEVRSASLKSKSLQTRGKNKSANATPSTAAAIPGSTSSVPAEATTSGKVAQHKDSANTTSIASGEDNDFLVRGVASAGLDSRTMRILEARIYDLVKEILDVDSMNVLRRNFVSLLRQSVKLFFSTTLKTWASAQAKVA